LSINRLGRIELTDEKLVSKIFEDIRASVAGRCLVEEPLSRHTSLRIGGPATFYVYPSDRDALRSLLQLCTDRRLEVLIIGYGNNLLVSDEGFPGCVIDLSDGFASICTDVNDVTAGSGAWLGDVVRLTADRGLSGMERLAGIPGSVGGGMSMNCGAFRTYISDTLIELEVMEMDGKTAKKASEEIDFGYRVAPMLSGKIVLQALFRLESEKPETVEGLITETISERFRRNVMTLPSAGSVFRNPEGKFAAQLLDEVGAKGLQTGGAKVSEGHANIIVNSGSGTAGDVVDLIKKLRGMVYKRHNIELKLELRTIGFDHVIDA